MQFKTLRNLSLIISLLATSFVTAKEAKTEPEKEETKKEKKKKEKMTAGYNAPCGIKVDRSQDFFVSASFIYWQAIQENMDLGVVSTQTAGELVHGHEVDLDNDFQPGFKIGIGMDIDHDNWDTYAEYTWYRASAHAKKSLDPNNTSTYLFPAWQIPDFLNPQYHYGQEKWKLRMDIVDWDLARRFYVGKELDMRPFIGVRAAWIRQSVDVDYINVNPGDFSVWPSTFIDQSFHSWGIGPRMGITSNWRFCEDFRLYGKGEVDVLFTEYDWRAKQTVTGKSGYNVHNDDAQFLRAHIDLGLGLGWGTYFAKNKYYIDFSADYSFQVFFDQNMFRQTLNAEALGTSIVPDGNLYLQGLTITARLDF